MTERICGSKFPIPLPQDHDSLCQGRDRRKEEGNKGTERKKKILPPWFLTQQFQKFVFFMSFLKLGKF